MPVVRFGITAKLFLAVLTTCIVVTVAMGVAVRISFQVGFEDYVLERETRRAAILSEALGDLYRETGDWRLLRDQPRRWWRILRSAPSNQHSNAPDDQPRDGYSPPPPFYLVDAAGAI